MGEEDVPPELRDVVAELLYHAQTIEWLLRVVLSDVNEAADSLVRPNGFRFKTRIDDLRPVPLGNLVKLYAAHSETNWLVQRLRDFVKVRNGMAHTAFIWGFFNRGKPADIKQAVDKTREHISEAKELVHALTIESARSLDLRTGRPVGPPPPDDRTKDT
jgi:hypothetical protein